MDDQTFSQQGGAGGRRSASGISYSTLINNLCVPTGFAKVLKEEKQPSKITIIG